MQKIVIDQHFRSLVPPLTKEESDDLEASIKADGCRHPLTVWKETGILLDGHNRLDICTRLGLGCRVEEIALADRIDAEAWVIRNQLARRNLSNDQIRLLRGRLYNLLKMPHGDASRFAAKETDEKPNVSPRGQNVHSGKTAKSVASQFGVDERTVRRDAKIAAKLEKHPEKAAEVAVGKTKLSDAVKSFDEPTKKASTAALADEVGKPLPTDRTASATIKDAFERRREITAIMSRLSDLKAQVMKSAASGDKLYARLNVSEFQSSIERCRAAMKAIRPHAVCPYCSGDGCRACKSQGWLGQWEYDAAPRESKP